MKAVRSSGYRSVGRSRWDVGESTCGILIGKPEGKRPLGRPRCKWMARKAEGNRPLAIPRPKWKVGES